MLHTASGRLLQPKPFLYQEVKGMRREIRGGYALKDGHQLGFQVAAYDDAKPLIIDPVIDYSSYLGGDGRDIGNAIAVDDQGFVYVTGETTSVNFPTDVGDTQLSNGVPPDQFILPDAFVSKIDPNAVGAASLVYSTYLGGGGIIENEGLQEAGLGIAVDNQGNAYITGKTSATDFPTVNAFQDQLNLTGLLSGTFRSDAFLVKLNADGSDLLYSSYLGGNGTDIGNAIAADDQGRAYVTGETKSSDFPTPGITQSFGGTSDVFVAKFNPASSGSNSLVFSKTLGGSGTDIGRGIALDVLGKVYMTGSTTSTNFPKLPSNAFQKTYQGGPSDAFVAKLDPSVFNFGSGPELLYSTYLGGGGTDVGTAIAVDRVQLGICQDAGPCPTEDRAVVTGFTGSTNFPLVKAFDTTNQVNEAFVTKLNGAGTGLTFSTFIGGNGADAGRGIALTPSANFGEFCFNGTDHVWVTGFTRSSSNFPLQAAFDPVLNGAQDAFVTLIGCDATLRFSSYLGGLSDDEGKAIAAGPDGNAYATGQTSSPDLPGPNNGAPNGFQPNNEGGSSDAFVTKIGLP